MCGPERGATQTERSNSNCVVLYLARHLALITSTILRLLNDVIAGGLVRVCGDFQRSGGAAGIRTAL